MAITLAIREEVTYEVTGESIYAAMKAFLADPNKHLTGVEERDVDIVTDPINRYKDRSLTESERDEIEAAERDG